ncbi:MAG: hypothetical protein IT580_15220 [Verrucomicrobiales bacterium]|nr:hypothetical protein [Verrucomicrobiales bacterium]
MASTAAVAHVPSAAAPVSPSLARLPLILAAIGGVGALIGMLVPGLQKQFAFSWLLAFMFYLSLMLGGLFLVILHHLFDAQWSVPIRRITEHLACLSPVIAVFFVPILVNALVAGPEKTLFQWMHSDPHQDHALMAKQALFNKPAWVVVSLAVLAVWYFLTHALRSASLKQDLDGAASHTRRLRFLAALGIFLFAVTLTLGAILWMKSLQWQWFSTMYGVYYFAGSVWLTVGTVYVITMFLHRAGPLRPVIQPVTYHDMGKLFFAFTVFYAYIAFSQYFLIWNANIPEETFWYVLREKGSWWSLGMLMIFGHFFLPFLLLLRIDTKMSLTVMLPLAVWAWVMHFCDLSFNIMPVLHPEGFVVHWLDLACMAFMGGVMALAFIRQFRAHPPFPQKDPRMAEALGIHLPATGGKSHGGAH